MNEFVIWGVPPNEKEEQLLITKFAGKYINNINTAKRIEEILIVKGCSNTRIQDLSKEIKTEDLIN